MVYIIYFLSNSDFGLGFRFLGVLVFEKYNLVIKISTAFL
jgi:hypothetical protein